MSVRHKELPGFSRVFSLCLLILALAATRVSVLIPAMQEGHLMLTGMQAVGSVAPPLTWRDGGPKVHCDEDFVQRVVEASAVPPSARMSIVRWSALCGLQLDLELQDEDSGPLYWLFAGLALATQGDLTQAKAAWNRHPMLARYFANLSARLLAEGRVDDALEASAIAREISPAMANRSYALKRAECEYYVYEARDLARAVSSCEQAAQLGEYNRDWHILGLVYYRLGRYEEAIAVSQQADSVVARYRQALSFEALGVYSRAEELLQDAIAESPDYWPAQVALVGLYLDQDRVCDAQLAAKELFVEACESDVDWLPDAYCDLLARDDLRSCNEH